jgi:hypothetical protein
MVLARYLCNGGEGMSAKRIITSFASLLLVASNLWAEVIPGRWEKVDGLKPGTIIIIKLKGGDRMECSFQTTSPSDIAFLDENEVKRKLPKSGVQQIESTEKVGDRLRNGAWIGAGVGAATGMLSWYAYANSVTASGPLWGEEGTGFFLAAGLVGAGIGAIAGTAVDAAIKGNEVLYKAP